MTLLLTPGIRVNEEEGYAEEKNQRSNLVMHS